LTAWLSNLRKRGLALRAAVLGIVVLGSGATAGPVAWWLGGAAGVTAAAAAAFLCLAGAISALVAGHLFRGPRHAWNALLVGMVARSGIPLAAALAIYLRGGPLAEAGLLYYLLVFYPVALTTEIVLSLPQDQHV